MKEVQTNSYSASEFRTPHEAPTDIVVFTITSTEKMSVKKTLPIRRLEVMLIRRRPKESGRCRAGLRGKQKRLSRVQVESFWRKRAFRMFTWSTSMCTAPRGGTHADG